MSVKTSSWLAAVVLGIAPVASAETSLPSFAEKLTFPPGSLFDIAKSTLGSTKLHGAWPTVSAATVAPLASPMTVSKLPVIDPGKTTDDRMIVAPPAAANYTLRVVAPVVAAGK